MSAVVASVTISEGTTQVCCGRRVWSRGRVAAPPAPSTSVGGTRGAAQFGAAQFDAVRETWRDSVRRAQVERRSKWPALVLFHTREMLFRAFAMRSFS
eukprot:TRINITY_DN20150_c0_g1_i2.p2 TRINITY_DN20150_c0_g1~~TRINITY_DN20150_c0_g1_i2.p2  ORF type:complete len:113 (-),score=15.37 TRINITY_DN20150_c0_g1_i2:21-314(-)